MFSRILSATTVALAASLVSAQTSTKCNPMDKKCPDDPALGGTISIDFTKGNNDFFVQADGTNLTYDSALGAVYTIAAEGNAPTVTSSKYIFFGKIDVTVRASVGTGVVTSFVLQSDDLDEIDWEWLGGDTAQVQTNYFGKGDTTTYDRGAYHTVPGGTPQSDFHTYSIDWTKDYVRWSINGNQVRELLYADAKSGTRFPQTPMQIKLGTWVAGGKDSPEGTVQWAGGYTNFADAPFMAYYQSITIQDYANGVDGAKYYSWADGSDGSYGSINVLTDAGQASISSSATSTSSTKSASATKSGDKTTLTTATSTTTGGLTQATDGTDTNTTITSTFASSTVGPTSSSTSTSSSASSTTSAAGTNGGMKVGASGVALGGAFLLLGFLGL